MTEARSHGGPPPAAPGERRKMPRLTVALWMEETFGSEVYYRRTGNLSAGGAYFDRAIPHPVGTAVTLRFNLPGDADTIVAQAAVVSAHDSPDGLGMSVKFVDIHGDGRARLQDYIGDGGRDDRR